MHGLITVILLCALAAIAVGLLSVVVPLKVLGITKRTHGALVMLGGIVAFGGTGMMIPSPTPEEAAIRASRERARMTEQQTPAVSPGQERTAATAAQVTEQEIEPDLFYLPPKERHLMPLLVKAAKLVSRSPDCLEVTDGSTSPSESRPRRPVFRITCRVNRPAPYDYENFYVTQEQLAQGFAQLGLPKAVDRNQAMEACMAYVRQNVALPDTVEFSALRSGEFETPNGNLRIRLAFTAKNAEGAELPFHANCLATAGGKFEASIQPR